ncbi:OapA family protein [Marinobacterium nitratireducens]|uniref:OapA family protein n=1 Tax=Marinobacterium nitratireducens TaxID=518897 RepID=UPI001E59A639|nr:peptidoglycan DD-metalloendopeptidase family protein [Marinobacterium nitratireducens]
MFNVIKIIGNRLPTVHLVAVSICVVIIGITLMLVPSEKVSATRGDRPESGALSQDTVKLELNLSEETDTEMLPTLQEESVSNEAAGNTAEQAPEPPAVAEAPAEPVENWVDYKVNSGDNLSSLFKRAGLSALDVHQVTQATRENKALSRIYPGETLSFLIEGGELKKLKHVAGPLKQVLLERDGDSYRTEFVEREPKIQHQFAEGTIENSLFLDGSRAGMSNNTIMQLAAIFGWDIDFALDIRKGDTFRVIYEEKVLDGKKIGTGNIVAAEFVNRGDVFRALRYTDSKGNTNYFTPEGNSMRKAFLRTPVDFARISSPFNPNRKHPVLNRIRAHKGVDYAASTGTPIKAAGDGKIIFRGVKGGYGNVIILQHGQNITTLYAHMSRFKKGLSVGSRVKQGQLIGYVGMSGMVTGPHLHYEFRVNGVHKNPVTVKLPHADPLPKSERAAFQSVSQTLLAQLDKYSATQVALAE